MGVGAYLTSPITPNFYPRIKTNRKEVDEKRGSLPPPVQEKLLKSLVHLLLSKEADEDGNGTGFRGRVATPGHGKRSALGIMVPLGL